MPDDYQTLCTQAASPGASAALAGLFMDTTREVDRLHARLRLQAAHACDRLSDALQQPDTTYIPINGVLNTGGLNTDLLAARCAQQLNQLALVLTAYRKAHPASET